VKDMPQPRTPIIAVVGAALCSAQETEAAREIGCALAQAGATLICGGRGGVMTAACQGAKEANGLTIGVLPGTDWQEANPYVDIPIVTGLGEARNVIIVHSAQAVIAVGGEYGTLSEMAFALKLGKPLIGLDSWGLTRQGQTHKVIKQASSPAEAVRLALEAAN